jgi:DNA-binding NtrC family response regulator
MDTEHSSSIVVIDDDIDHLSYVTTLLTRAGYACVSFSNARDALAHMKLNQAALVVTDIFMPDMDGFELLRALHRVLPAVPVVTLSGEGRMTKDFYLECAEHLGAVATLRKPFDPEALCLIVARYATLRVVPIVSHPASKGRASGK